MNESIKQEIWSIREEIKADEWFIESSNVNDSECLSDFYSQQVLVLKEKLDDLLDAYPEFKTEGSE